MDNIYLSGGIGLFLAVTVIILQVLDYNYKKKLIREISEKDELLLKKDRLLSNNAEFQQVQGLRIKELEEELTETKAKLSKLTDRDSKGRFKK